MRFLLLTLILGLCLSSQASAQESLHKIETVNSALVAHANAVVRLNEIHVTYNSPKNLKVEEHRIVTVLNSNGKNAVEAYLHYNDDTRRKNLEAYFYDKNGKEIKKVRKSDFNDVSAVGNGTLYADSRIKYLSSPVLQFPYTVDFKASFKTSNTAYMPGFHFVQFYNTGVEKAVYKVNYDTTAHKIRFKEKNFRDYDITIQKTADGRTYIGKNINAIRAESFSPAEGNYVPQILTEPNDFYIFGKEGHSKNWNEMGKWMDTDILKDRDELPEATKAKMKELTKDVADPIEKARIIYHYVQNNTRYISVQVGIGGIQPIPANEVDNMKYGDCKGLTNYTKALLESVGVPSYYVHVEAGSEKVDFEENFSSLWQGNHVILCIPNGNDVIWADCTNSRIPFGFIGRFTDDRRVLVMKPEGGELMRTTSYLNTDNYQNTTGDMTIGIDGSLNSNLKISSGGTQYEDHYRIGFLSQSDLLKYDRKYWSFLKDLNIESHTFDNDKTAQKFTENIKLSTPKFASKFGKRMLFLVNPLNKHTSVPPRYAKRTTPFIIQRGYLDEDSLKIHIPENYKVEAIPDSVSLKTKFGTYNMQVKKIDAKTLSYHKKVLIKAGNYTKDQYEAYRDFRKKIAKSGGAKIAIIKNP